MSMNYPNVDAYFVHGSPVMIKHQVGGTAIAAGDVIVAGEETRIAHNDHPANSLASLAAPGGNSVYRMRKPTGTAIADGARVWYDAAEKRVTTTQGSNKPAGIACRGGAASADTHVFIRHEYFAVETE